MRMVSIVFKKKMVGGKWTILDPKMADPHNSGSAFNFFFNFAQWNNNGLYQKVFVQDKGAILDPKLAHPHNSGLALRIF